MIYGRREHPWLDEDRRQDAWDRYLSSLPSCCFCGKPIFVGSEYYVCRNKNVCIGCFEELEDNVAICEG